MPDLLLPIVQQVKMPNYYDVAKYQQSRHRLFHRFDEGIRMDNETWHSVTPEIIARHHARRFVGELPQYPVLLDAFLGGAVM